MPRTTEELLKDAEAPFNYHTIREWLSKVSGVPAMAITTEKHIKKIEANIAELSAKLKEAERRTEELRSWFESTWMKGVPDINTTVLIKHELGCGENHDVACYLGKDNKGDDRFMMSNGTVIFRKHIIRWRAI